LRNQSIFGNDLYELGLGEKIEGDFKRLISGPGAVRATIQAINQEYGKY
jgi:fructuronate reductase